MNESVFGTLGGMKWEDVFNYWRLNEELEKHWIEYWKEKGFKSWEEWRNNYAVKFKLEDRNGCFIGFLILLVTSLFSWEAPLRVG
jgi:hypothetical protein